MLWLKRAPLFTVSPCWRRVWVRVSLICAIFFTASQLGSAAEFLAFPQISGSVSSQPIAEKKRHGEVGVDFFYTADYASVRLLAEYFLSSDEHEFERLQLGWLINSSTTLWAGRFHSPLGYWNTEFHHGQYLKTAISHPAIESYEDESGVLPTHIAGILFDGRIGGSNGSEWRYIAAFGRGPNIEDGELVPWNVTDPKHGGSRTSALRLSYLPDALGDTEFGIFAGYSQIPIAAMGYTRNVQHSAGIYGNWDQHPFKTTSAWFYVRNQLDGGGTQTRNAFSNAYIQIEYAVSDTVKIFARDETTFGAKDDPYLNWFPDFPRRRALAGLRYDIAPKQAIKFEASRRKLQSGLETSVLEVQWSMVLP